MRPSGDGLRSSGRWFLRSRGDAPDCSAVAGDTTEVPPLTRRCALDLALRRARPCGSSAHAEMRRSCSPAIRSSRGFLRSRGDAPSAAVHVASVTWVPPLTRRCAPRDGTRFVWLQGSSAHAEMRRSGVGGRGRPARFLRSRGDAPPPFRPRIIDTTVPPLTRRCAGHGLDADVVGQGSSAHAEMRPWVAKSEADRFGFLRSRGDAPSAAGRPM